MQEARYGRRIAECSTPRPGDRDPNRIMAAMEARFGLTVRHIMSIADMQSIAD